MTTGTTKYPFIGIRVNPATERRFRRLAKISHKKLSAVIRELALAKLPEMEREAGIAMPFAALASRKNQ